MTLGQIRPSPAERRRRNRDEMIAAILDASRQIMREEGVAALNLQEVARRLGIRAPSLYEYFDGKMALYDALFRLGVRIWAGRVEDLASREYASPWEFLRAVAEAYVDFGDEHPEMYKMIHERHVPGFEPSPEALAESVRLTELGVQALQPWIESGAIVTDLSPAEAFDLFIVVLHGLTGTHVADQPGNRSADSRFYKLIPHAVALFQAAWSPRETSPRPGPRRKKTR